MVIKTCQHFSANILLWSMVSARFVVHGMNECFVVITGLFTRPTLKVNNNVD